MTTTQIEPGPRSQTIMPMSMHEIMDIASVFAKSKMFKDISTPEQAAVLIMAGLGMRIQPFAAIRGIRISARGEVIIDVHLLAAQLKQSKRYDYRVTVLNATACEIEFTQDGKPLGKSTYTQADARAAGLLDKDNWKRNPTDMYYAAAMRKGVKRFCPDALSGLDILETDPAEPAHAEPASAEQVQEYLSSRGDGTLTEEDAAREAAPASAAQQAAQDDPHEAAPIEEARALGGVPAQPPTEPAAPPANGNGNGKTPRPYAPETLKLALAGQAAKHADAVLKPHYKGTIVGILNEVFADRPDPEQARHDLLTWLLGTPSTKDLTNGQVMALWSWLKPGKGDGGTWECDEMARREARNAYAAAIRPEGQTALL